MTRCQAKGNFESWLAVTESHFETCLEVNESQFETE